MNAAESRVAIIATPHFLKMAEYIVTYLGAHDIPAIIANVEEERFADSEVNPHILNNIRNKQIYFLCEMQIGEQAHRIVECTREQARPSSIPRRCWGRRTSP